MKTSRVVNVLLMVALAVAPSARSEAQGIGGLIKKKAADALGTDKSKAAEPKPGLNTKTDCPEINDDVLDRFVKGLEAELAEYQAADAIAAKPLPKAEYDACQVATITTPEGSKLSELFTVELGKASQADASKLLNKFNADVAALVEAKCGKTQAAANIVSRDRKQNAYLVGLKASGLVDKCYARLKEHAIPFCRLSKETQQLAATKGIQGTSGSYTPNEGKAYSSQCTRILALAKDLGM